MRFIATGDDEQIARYDFGGPDGAPPLLLSHATGFHAHCYEPIASVLADRFRVSSLDYRGHGMSTVDESWQVDWSRFGDDAFAAGRDAAPDGGLIGFGHSMGGAALLMAAHRDPELFDRLVLFEPICHQSVGAEYSVSDMEQLPIVQGARRRRSRFDSYEAAIANYAAKPPMSEMTPEVLELYVRHGFAPAADGAGVVLRCNPIIEAGIFLSARDNGVWPLLADIAVPTLVISGHVTAFEPSSHSEPIANELNNGTYLRLDHMSHFGPFSHPIEIANLIADSPSTSSHPADTVVPE